MSLLIGGFVAAMALLTATLSGVFGMAGGLVLMGALACEGLTRGPSWAHTAAWARAAAGARAGLNREAAYRMGPGLVPPPAA